MLLFNGVAIETKTSTMEVRKKKSPDSYRLTLNLLSSSLYLSSAGVTGLSDQGN